MHVAVLSERFHTASCRPLHGAPGRVRCVDANLGSTAWTKNGTAVFWREGGESQVSAKLRREPGAPDHLFLQLNAVPTDRPESRIMHTFDRTLCKFWAQCVGRCRIARL